MSERLERWIPASFVITALAAYALVCYLGCVPVFKADPRGLLSMINDVAAIFVGFIIATTTFLITESNSSGMQFVRQAGKFGLLISYFVTSSVAWLCLCIVNLVLAGYITAESWSSGNRRLLVLGAWLGLAAYAVGSLFRLLLILKSVAMLLQSRE